MKIPTHLKDFNIYDVIYNQVGEYVLVAPKMKPMNIKLIRGKSSYDFDLFNCSHGHTSVYICKHSRSLKNITLEINGVVVKNIKVSRYQNFENKIVMSTMVRNEDNYVRQWIEFHRLLGVSRFIIYDNSKYHGKEPKLSTQTSSDLEKLLEDYITQGIVDLIEWNYPYRLMHPDRRRISGQTTQQCHTIHAFKNAKLIGLFDIDEYVNASFRSWEDLNTCFEHILSSGNLSFDDITGFMLFSKSFYNPTGADETGFEFMKIAECGESIYIHPKKLFVNPRNVLTYSCHRTTNHVQGKTLIKMKSDQLYYNHYVYLNKLIRKKRGIHSGPTSADDSILVMYDRLLSLK
jgi:hypothetical protein